MYVHEQARSAGWLFPIPPATDPLDMWRLFDFTAVSVQFAHNSSMQNAVVVLHSLYGVFIEFAS